MHNVKIILQITVLGGGPRCQKVGNAPCEVCLREALGCAGQNAPDVDGSGRSPDAATFPNSVPTVFSIHWATCGDQGENAGKHAHFCCAAIADRNRQVAPQKQIRQIYGLQLYWHNQCSFLTMRSEKRVYAINDQSSSGGLL